MAISQLQQTNVAAAAIYTEYSVIVPPGAMNVTMQLRPSETTSKVYWYMESNNPSPGSAANLPEVYGTIPAGASRTIMGKLGGQTIYFQVDGADQVLELDYHADN